MKEFVVKHTCGHEVKHRFGGLESDRRVREEWLRGQPCQICWQKTQADASTNRSRDLGLPALDGEPDDIAWAEVIRQKAIAHNADFCKRVTMNAPNETNPDPAKTAAQTAASAALHDLQSHTSAAWWIENRFEVLNFVRRAAVKAVTPILEE